MALSLQIFSTSGRRLYCGLIYFIFGSEKRFGFFFEFQFFSISWKHNYHLLKDPCEEKFAIFTVDGARNFLSKPITKKEPITVDIMKKLYDHCGVSSDLSDLRIYCMLS